MERADKEGFVRMKKEYTNRSLEDFVTNENDKGKERIIRFKNRLYQNYDQIFMDPVPKFIKAHFYAPRKQVFGHYFDTLTVNVFVIWLMTTFIYAALYYKLLRRLIDSSSKIKKTLKKDINTED